MKGISIKNSFYVERINDFVSFLIENKVDREVPLEYLKYYYADGSLNGKEEKRLSVEEYKKYNRHTIDAINTYFNQEEI